MHVTYHMHDSSILCFVAYMTIEDEIDFDIRLCVNFGCEKGIQGLNYLREKFGTGSEDNEEEKGRWLGRGPYKLDSHLEYSFTKKCSYIYTIVYV